MSDISFRITDAKGVVHEGRVHGSGGLIGAEVSHLEDRQRARALSVARLRRIAKVAEKGRRGLTVVEPKTGHVMLYPDATYSNSIPGPEVPWVAVDLRGATIELVPERTVT